jgi:hypothetical protein
MIILLSDERFLKERTRNTKLAITQLTQTTFSRYESCDEGGPLRRVTRAHAVIRLASRVLAYRRGEPFGNGQAKDFCLGECGFQS